MNATTYAILTPRPVERFRSETRVKVPAPKPSEVPAVKDIDILAALAFCKEG